MVGIDEVGRGPLAGPVTVCAFALPVRAQWFKRVKLPLRDSKQLSASQRERWVGEIRRAAKKGEAIFAVRSIPPAHIDRINISRAANLAATRAFRRVQSLIPAGSKIVLPVLLDGGLKVNLPVRQLVHAKADERYPVVSLASITAKVSRDRRMCRLALVYPCYQFDENKGYGTALHIRALRKRGPSPEHRRTFISGLLARRRKTG